MRRAKPGAKIQEPRRSPRQQRAHDTVETILEATARVLVKHGYKGASTNRIAEVAGVSIGTLYQYFPSKEALLSALSRRHSERMSKVFQQRFAEARALPLRQAVRLIIQAELEALQVDLPLLRVLFDAVPRFGPPQHIAAVQALVGDLLQQGLSERTDEIRAADAELTSFVLLYAVEGVCQAALRERPELVGQARFLDACTELVLRYVAPAADEKKPLKKN
jgi:AcrR family transcriptional regulator